MEQQELSREQLAPYKGYDIYRITTPGGERHVAYKPTEIEPAARSKTLPELKGVLDVLVAEAARHAEADHLRDATKPIIAEV